MKELLFILLIFLVLMAITIIRYRKKIAGLIGMARMLKDVRDQIRRPNTLRSEVPGVHLVSCAKCGVWIPENKAVRRGGKLYCSNECALTRAT